MRLALIAAVALSLPVVLVATAADARGCGRHGGRDGGFRDASLGRFAFNRALLSGKPDCLTREQIVERRARRAAAHGGYYEVHGRYQH